MLPNSFSPTSQGKPLGCNRLGSWPNQHLRKITHLHIHAAILWIYGGCWGEVVVGVVWFCSYHPRQSTPVGAKQGCPETIRASFVHINCWKFLRASMTKA